MKKIKKILIIAALVALFLAVALIAALRAIPAGDLIRRNVEERIEKDLGRKARVERLQVGFSASSLVSVRVKGLCVFAETGEEILSADEIELRPRLFPLIRGMVVIRALEVNGFTVKIVRGRDGAVVHPFSGSPRAQGTQKKRPSMEERSTGRTDSPADSRPSPPSENALGWSVVKTSLSHGTITWRDERPDRAIEWSLRDMAAKVSQVGDSPEFTFRVEGRAGSSEPNNRLILQGNAKFRPGFTGTQRLEMTLVADRPDVESLRAYLPDAADALGVLTVERVKARLDLAEGAAPETRFEVDLGLKDRGAVVTLRGTFAPTPDLSQIRSLQCTAELQSVSPAPARAFLHVPDFLDISSAVIDGRVEGAWRSGEPWTARAGLTVRGVGIVGRLAQIPNAVSLRVESEANPQEIRIKRLETVDPEGLCAVEGKITDFTSDTQIDLEAHISLPSGVIASLGGPHRVRLSGAPTIPVKLGLKGPVARVRTTLSADLKDLGLTWPPYFEKTAGAKSVLSAEGMLNTGLGRAPTAPPSLAVHGTMVTSGVKARGAARGKWLSPLSIALRGTIIHTDGKTRVKEATARVAEAGGENFEPKASEQKKEAHGKRAEDALTEKEILKARFSLENSSSEIGELSADMRVNRALLEACVPEYEGVLSSFKGSTVVSARVKGTPTRGTWRMIAPMEGLDAAFGASFRKPAGIRGNLTAQGVFRDGSFRIEKADMRVPGLSILASDVAVDDKGLPSEVKFTLPRTKLEGLALYVPAIKGAGLHGSVEGRAVLQAILSHPRAEGSLTLSESSWRPVDARWGIEAVTGDILFKNDSIHVESMSGRLIGSLQGPLKFSAALENLANPSKLKGTASLDAGKGAVKAELVSYLLSRAGIPAEQLFSVLQGPQAKDFLPYDYVRGDFIAEEGAIRTDNLRLRGKAVNIGAIGGLRLPGSDLDALLGLRTILRTGEVIAGIPGLQEILKRNRGIIKATGIERELEKIGVKLPEIGESASKPEASQTPITLLLSFKGPVSNPRVKPELESGMEKRKATRIKSLIE
jgi:hypothetical protein